MKTTIYWFFIFIITASMGCESKETKTPVFHLAAPRSNANEDISKFADQLLKRIGALESEKDVVCWTSFRQLDQFIATKEYSPMSTLTKVEVQKEMVLAIWDMASDPKNKAKEITSSDLKKILGNFQKKGDLTFQKNLRDYRTTSDHWRVILAVLMDQLAANIIPKAMSEDALNLLGEFVLHYSIELLNASAASATLYRTPFIEPINIVKAAKTLNEKYKLKTIPKPIPRRDFSPQSKLLFSLTKNLIHNKIEALKHFNANDPRAKVQPKSDSTFDAINLISPLPLEQDAFKELFNSLRSFAMFASAGHLPMRSDNYLADGRFASAKIRRQFYVDAIRMENICRQVFPHRVNANGDVDLRFEPNPGIVPSTQLKPFDFLMLDHQQNAVRDSAIHWQVLALVFMDRPFALDPFSAEILSENVSMMFSYTLFRSAEIAKKAGHPSILLEDIKKARDARFTQVRPIEDTVMVWSDEEENRKRAVLSNTKISFLDQSKRSGFPKTGFPDEISEGIQTVMGSGMASGDIDGDGDLDVFVAGIAKNILYINDGSGKFRKANQEWGIPKDVEDARGVLFVDWNGDSKLDLFIIRSLKPSLLLEQRDGKFVDVSKESGFITGVGAHVIHAYDFDNDNDLDIYVGYYGADSFNSGEDRKQNLPSIDGRNGTHNQLFEYRDGKYVDVAEKLGADDIGWALAISAWDFDRDGDFDLYIANDFGPNVFLEWRDGKYVDVSRSTQTADRGGGMNISFTDANGDGYFDFYISNIDMFSKFVKVIFPTVKTTIKLNRELQESFQFLNGNRFYISHMVDDPKYFVSEEKSRFEPKEHGWSWAANFFDADNDGDEEMYLVNGWIEGSTASDQANQLFIAEDGSYFAADVEKTASKNVQYKGNSRSLITQDFDGDGRIDILVNNFRSPLKYFKNTSKSKKNWVSFKLVGKGKNTQAIGAVITLKTKKKTMKRMLLGGDGYLSQHPLLHFGLGSQDSFSYEVLWPDGTKTTSRSTANQKITVIEDSK